MPSNFVRFLSRYPFLFRPAHKIYRTFVPSVPVRIERALGNRSAVFFVQVGSNDGKQGDPLHDLIRRHDSWRGLFIEPVKFVFDRLKSNYPASNRFIFENVAIAERTGKMPFYYLSPAAKKAFGNDVPFWYDQLGSFDRSHLIHHCPPGIEDHIIEEQIECLSFEDLCRRNNISKFDLLHIDAEGYDFKILSQVDIPKYQPTIILFEKKHLTPEEVQKSRELASRHGYTLHDYRDDFLFVKEA